MIEVFVKVGEARENLWDVLPLILERVPMIRDEYDPWYEVVIRERGEFHTVAPLAIEESLERGPYLREDAEEE